MELSLFMRTAIMLYLVGFRQGIREEFLVSLDIECPLVGKWQIVTVLIHTFVFLPSR